MYRVALVYTRKAKGYEGVITWTAFTSEEAFQKFYTDKIKELQRVVEQGVSEERCIELAKQTPRACLIAAAVENNRNPETGAINHETLEMELAGAVMAGTFS